MKIVAEYKTAKIALFNFHILDILSDKNTYNFLFTDFGVFNAVMSMMIDRGIEISFCMQTSIKVDHGNLIVTPDVYFNPTHLTGPVLTKTTDGRWYIQHSDYLDDDVEVIVASNDTFDIKPGENIRRLEELIAK